MVTIYGPPNSAKRRFLGKFGFYNIIYIFKNYFVTVFSIINYQFLVNKRYLNTPLIYERCYVYNIFTTNHKWLVVIDSNLNLTLRLFFYPNNNN